MVIWLKINFPRDTRRRLAVNNLWMQCDVSCREDIINVSNEASPMGIGSTMKRIVEWGKSRFTNLEKKQQHVPNIFPRPKSVWSLESFLVGVYTYCHLHLNQWAIVELPSLSNQDKILPIIHQQPNSLFGLPRLLLLTHIRWTPALQFSLKTFWLKISLFFEQTPVAPTVLENSHPKKVPTFP